MHEITWKGSPVWVDSVHQDSKCSTAGSTRPQGQAVNSYIHATSPTDNCATNRVLDPLILLFSSFLEANGNLCRDNRIIMGYVYLTLS